MSIRHEEGFGSGYWGATDPYLEWEGAYATRGAGFRDPARARRYAHEEELARAGMADRFAPRSPWERAHAWGTPWERGHAWGTPWERAHPLDELARWSGGWAGHESGPPWASELAEGPYYGRGPKGYKRADERIRDEICETIARQGYIDASDVEVVVESGVVRLMGSVPQRRDKRGLEYLVERVPGVEEIRNELRLNHRDVAADRFQSRVERQVIHPHNGKNARA